jgi:hypothetical protein
MKGMKRKLQRIVSVFLLATASLAAGDKRLHLLPKLQPAQIITYLIRFQADKSVKTDSQVVMPMAPNAAQIDAHGLLQIEVLDQKEMSGKAEIHARAQFLTLDSAISLKKPADKKPVQDKQLVDPSGKSIEFTISPDGSVNGVRGLDSLFPDQQQAWQQWVARFALAWTLPADGVKFGEKWKWDQSEQAAAPIAGLQWARQSNYVKDEPCQATQLSIMGDVAASAGALETCAVLLTSSTLNQKSSSKSATPEGFKLHDLRTMGTAKGASEIITYISLTSGLVVRATEETTQLMDVVVATADGSNRVHYKVDAKSHAEVLLVTQTPLGHP